MSGNGGKPYRLFRKSNKKSAASAGGHEDEVLREEGGSVGLARRPGNLFPGFDYPTLEEFIEREIFAGKTESKE